MNNKKKVFIYYLSNLLARGESVSVDSIRKAAKEQNLVAYLLKMYPEQMLERIGDFSELNEELANYDYTWDMDKYLLEEPINGLALLLCLIANEC